MPPPPPPIPFEKLSKFWQFEEATTCELFQMQRNPFALHVIRNKGPKFYTYSQQQMSPDGWQGPIDASDMYFWFGQGFIQDNVLIAYENMEGEDTTMSIHQIKQTIRNEVMDRLGEMNQIGVDQLYPVLGEAVAPAIVGESKAIRKLSTASQPFGGGSRKQSTVEEPEQKPSLFDLGVEVIEKPPTKVEESKAPSNVVDLNHLLGESDQPQDPALVDPAISAFSDPAVTGFNDPALSAFSDPALSSHPGPDADPAISGIDPALMMGILPQLQGKK